MEILPPYNVETTWSEPALPPPAVEAEPEHKPGLLTCALAGLHAGIIGVFWMLVVFVVGAYWLGGSIWSVPNLFSTIFYGDFAWQDEFSHTTWAGIAFLVVAYGLIGALWGCWWKDDQKPLLRLFGAFTGLVIYYLCFDFIWPRVNPSIPLYSSVREMQIAHVLWGAALASSPGYARRMTNVLTGKKN